MSKVYYTLLCFLFLVACQADKTTSSSNDDVSQSLKEGTWRVVLDSEGGKVPFLLTIEKQQTQLIGYLKNAEEKILLDTIITKGDSLTIPLHIFDAALVGKIEGEKIQGIFHKYYAPEQSQDFIAYYNQSYRFAETSSADTLDVAGKWQVTFTDQEGESYPAIGIFEQEANLVTGTFLTETGDYRYLEGNIVDNQLLLSTFDGNHAFLFKATMNDQGALTGEFWSGKDYQETWKATRNAAATLSDPYQLTYLKEGYDRLAFRFPDLDSNMVSLEDAKYQDKVVIVQIFGTWCPNCMDETAFLADWYTRNKNQPVEIIGLAYERKPDFAYAKKRVQKVIDRFGVDNTFLIAGINDKKEAAKTLPMLNEIISFPTTIFIDKKGKVRAIHTGFTGPGTGTYYTAWREEFNDLMGKLLSE